MSGIRLSLSRTAPAGADAEETAVQHEPVLLLTQPCGREAFLRMAAERIPAGECLVEIKDLASRRRSFDTRPLDPRARLVAETPPTQLRGSLVSRVRYYRVPADSLRAVETHRENGAYSHQYEVRLKPVLRGCATGAPELPA